MKNPIQFRSIALCCVLSILLSDRPLTAADLLVETYADPVAVGQQRGRVLLRYQTAPPERRASFATESQPGTGTLRALG